MCVVSMLDGVRVRDFKELGRTECLMNSLSPEWSKKIALDYYFEERQVLKFDIYDVDSACANVNAHDYLGTCQIALGEIVAAPGGRMQVKLRGSGVSSSDNGTLTVCAEEVGEAKEVICMTWRGNGLDKKDFLGKSDPFLMFYRKNDDNSHDLIGTCQTTVSRLDSGEQTAIPLINPKRRMKKKNYKDSGVLSLVSCKVVKEGSFLDYIRGGTQIHFTVAVDFTASNGNPVDPRSLHYINPTAPNQYMVALSAVGEICQDYNQSKMFAALGFGAKIHPSGQVSHNFSLNFANPSDPFCYGVDGILNAYRQALPSVQLYGPTNFSPIINHMAGIASRAPPDGLNYHVLLIITDGIISDLQVTITSIIAASSLPMSIIIVGVGAEDFSSMEILDADNCKLTDGNRTAQRDIVQFVPLRNFLNSSNDWRMSQARLAKEVLAEIPAQLTSYMQLQGIAPRPPLPPNMNVVNQNMGSVHGPPTASTAGVPYPVSNEAPPAYPLQGGPGPGYPAVGAPSYPPGALPRQQQQQQQQQQPQQQQYHQQQAPYPPSSTVAPSPYPNPNSGYPPAGQGAYPPGYPSQWTSPSKNQAPSYAYASPYPPPNQHQQPYPEKR